MEKEYILTIQCPDKVGVVSTVSTILQQNNANIVEAIHHTDIEESQFFMRHELIANSSSSITQIEVALEQVSTELSMNWKLVEKSEKKKVVLLATKETHCLVDILHRSLDSDCPYEILAVIANHEEINQYAKWYGLPFYHVDFVNNGKENAFQEVEDILDKYSPDIIGLAKFMQIIPSSLCDKYGSKLINIHHSFLPSFVGSKPYHKAYERGVKLIGATCHYVTEDLDQGPIIEQEVVRISHQDNTQAMIKKGRECEKVAFARGLEFHAENRVFIYKSKTIVLK